MHFVITGELKYFSMVDNNMKITATLKWSNEFEMTAQLDNIGVECMYQGSIPGDNSSILLVTGCKNEVQDIQIQSSKYGDTLGTVLNGTVELLYSSDSDGVTNSYTDYNIDNDGLKMVDEVQYQGSFPKGYLLDIHFYLSKSWQEFFGTESERKAKFITKHATNMLNHTTLDVKILLKVKPKYMKIDDIFVPSPQDLDHLIQVIPAYRQKPGIAHIMLTNIGPPKINGIAKTPSVCENDKSAVAIVRWHENSMSTAQTLAHEIGHLFGMFHDHETHAGRNYKCEEGEIYMMGQGTSLKKRSSYWSDCSNSDFKLYWINYFRQHLYEKHFCLSGEE